MGNAVAERKKGYSGGVITTKKKSLIQKIFEQRELLLMSVPLLLYRILFSYVPITGWSMAFQDFKPGRSFMSQVWVGLKHFRFLFQNENFVRDIRNTLAMSVISLVLGYFCAILLALMLNEVKKRIFFKRLVQNVSYLPHFLSWIIVAGLVSSALSTENGIINEVLMFLRIVDKPILFLGTPKYFWGIVAGSNLWKSVGWNSIIYLAAMTAIDPSLYEAADMDGANRYQKVWSITLPGIKPTIIILLIMSIGNILEAGFEIQYFLGNGLVVDYSETIDIFVLKYGIKLANFSLATAAGIFKTIVSIILLSAANFLAGRLGEDKLV